MPHLPHHQRPRDPPRPSTPPSSTAQAQPQLQTTTPHALPPRDPEHPPVQAPGAPPLLKCGPLLRYCGTTYFDELAAAGEKDGDKDKAPEWRGSVLLVIAGRLQDKVEVPEVRFTGEVVGRKGPGEGGDASGEERRDDEGIGLAIGDEGDRDRPYHRGDDEHGDEHQNAEAMKKNLDSNTHTDQHGITRKLIRANPKLVLAEDHTLFYRYDIHLLLEEAEREVTYIVTGLQKPIERSRSSHDSTSSKSSSNSHSEKKSSSDNEKQETTTAPITTTFPVPSATSTMRILFHSCNGFSVGTDEAAWSGPALWSDIQRTQSSPTTAYHVMLGGGDQIYSDAIRVSGPLKHWASIKNPSKRRHHPYPDDLAVRVNNWYRENYIQWYSTPPFSHLNGRIPAVNMWDDHDIIDGFGSYTDRTMRCPVFLGVGRAAWRYYMVFQHHTPPESADEGGKSGEGGAGEDPSWILSPNQGPYIPQRGRSLYARLGRGIAFVALDARTERTRHTICPASTYDAVFTRLDTELSTAAGGGGGGGGASPSSPTSPIKHVLLLLGVPIAYPRLVWLETFLRSPFMGALKFLHKRFGLASGAFNKFDGEVDILDDLDDHWAARVHKRERADVVHRWQALARGRGVRVVVLSGDVHLAALGRFYTRPRGARHPIPKKGLRTPLGVADPPREEEEEAREYALLRRDHRYTPNIISSAITNKPPPAAVSRLLARRNKVHRFDERTDETMVGLFVRDVDGGEMRGFRFTMARRNYCRLKLGGGEGVGEGEGEGGKGEGGQGEGQGARGGEGDLRVEFRVEVDQKDPEGRTKGYAFVVPGLEMRGVEL